MPPRSDPGARVIAAAFIGALALPALVLIALALAADLGPWTLLIARVTGFLAFAALAVLAWRRLRRTSGG